MMYPPLVSAYKAEFLAHYKKRIAKYIDEDNYDSLTKVLEGGNALRSYTGEDLKLKAFLYAAKKGKDDIAKTLFKKTNQRLLMK